MHFSSSGSGSESNFGSNDSGSDDSSPAILISLLNLPSTTDFEFKQNEWKIAYLGNSYTVFVVVVRGCITPSLLPPHPFLTTFCVLVASTVDTAIVILGAQPTTNCSPITAVLETNETIGIFFSHFSKKKFVGNNDV
jgi:hypothetical protein